ncbi:DNA-directed RNA polymerase III subunit RPC4 isoform X2 [Pezoporus flaviventris]|uniref:DNA-directed RNA polymerase III subunit RPC4 isoform X2 n=2 Tax=Pezoporus TaxID=35539 RepID=UPI002AB168B1|nr:DNA-directed RNA polymerase III subunit RPC4 isoform X2 [Pezoporus flaviventris]
MAETAPQRTRSSRCAHAWCGREPVAARAGPRMAEGGSGDAGSGPSLRPGLPGARGLLGRRPGAPPVTPGRLPSIRSRDLTLGGVKKKTFTPNIISRKIKEEPREETSVKKEKKERERQRDGHGRGRGRPAVIQSHSIFEQGPAEMMKKKGSWDKTVDMSDFGPSHIINIKKEKRETDEETKQILRMLQKDDFLDDPGLKNDIRNKPVQLPLAHSGWLFKEESGEQEDAEPWVPGPKEEKMELDPSAVKVKEEPCDEAPPRPAPSRAPPGFPRDVPVSELLQRLRLSAEEELLFLQLPDTLPGQPPSHDTKPARPDLHGEDAPGLLGKQDKSQELRQAENTCTLSDLPEGQVGKLLVRKSGKVQLVLGKVTLDVTMGTPCSFLQELVSVGIGDGRTGEMMVLGHVKHKLVCSPDFEALLEHRHR